MSKAVFNLNVDQGMTYSRRFVWKINRNPVNLTGYVAALIIGTGSSSSRGLTITSNEGQGIVLGGSEGTILVTLTPSQTSSLQAGKHSYALELTSPGGVKTRILRGLVINEPRATNVR
jgi:hypothetical protein